MTPAERPPVWRVSLLWEGTVLDTVSVKGKSQTLLLRTGEQLHAKVVADGLELRGDRLLVTLTPGQFCALPAGHVLHADVDAPAPPAPSWGGVDSTLLHSTMIGVALQVCVVSALWLAPVSTTADVGAGVPSDVKRWMSLPGGTARVVGRASFSATGRKADEAEKVDVQKKKGAPAPSRAGKGLSLEQTLEAMKVALHVGDSGDLRESIGQLSQATARAPQLGNGIGGLAPRDPIDTGPGSGIIGAGTTVALDDIIRARIAEADKRLVPATPPKPTVFPVTMTTVPDANVDGSARIDADPELDPEVREHLTRMIRGRHNVIRGCYESWGLAADARRSGRLVLTLTLLPNGKVADVEVETNKELRMVGECVERAASEWYLGDIVEEPTRLAFPFVLQPRT